MNLILMYEHIQLSRNTKIEPRYAVKQSILKVIAILKRLYLNQP